MTVILPEFVPARWWHHLFHNQTSLLIKGALLFRPNIVVTSVPFHLSRQVRGPAFTSAGQADAVDGGLEGPHYTLVKTLSLSDRYSSVPRSNSSATEK